MDFIGGLQQSKGMDTILVVVDRLSKYTHFYLLAHPFSAKDIALLFIKEVVHLHGFPSSIVSDRDKIFMSAFWFEVFKQDGTSLKMSSVYHPRTDSQTEAVNKSNQKLGVRFYGPYEVLKKIGVAAYKLRLPPSAKIYPIFHVSLLKKSLGSSVESQSLSEALTEEGELLVEPEQVLDNRMSNQGNLEMLIKSQNLSEFESTWERADKLQLAFPSFHLEDKVGGDRLDSTEIIGNTREGGLNEWQQKRFSSDGWNIFQTSKTYNLNDEQQRQSPRALIEAYGCHKGHEIPSTKLLLVEQPSKNCLGSKFPLASWQDTEEEEFNWKYVNPGLVDCSRNSSSMQSNVRFSRKRKLSNDLSNSSQYPFNMGVAPPAVNAHATRPSGLNPAFPLQKCPRSLFEPINVNNDTNMGHGPNRTMFIHE
nr:uncharacterized protein LOC112701142 [Arachis hypogaea]